MASKTWQTPFDEALQAVRSGDFDGIRRALQSLGFVFHDNKDGGHCNYYHPKLISDPLFRYPRNLFRPHGKNRSSDVSPRDKSQAKQIIEALRDITAPNETGDEDQGGKQK